MAEQQATEKAATAPSPDDERKPDEVTEISKSSWKYVLGKTLREFSRDQCTDLAAALTYFAVLAIFPALLALVSLLGLVSDPQQTTQALLDLAGQFLSADVVKAIEAPIQGLTEAPAAGVALVTGILGALWSASGFVGAFARASNRIYEVEEGRGFLQLRPVQFGVTIVAVVLMAVAAGILVLSGPVAEAIGAAIGLGAQAVMIWNIIKWPIVVAIAIFVLALLFYAAPNVKQPKFKWVSVGSLVALVIWALATFGFAFYVTNFGNYEKTYGSLGGVIAFLLWIWISNNALLFGVELDSELERGRQLQGGIAAEETLQLPPRGTKKSEKMAEQRAADVLHGYQLRKQHEDIDYSSDDPDKRNDNKRDGKKDDDKKNDGGRNPSGDKKRDEKQPKSHGKRDAWRNDQLAHSGDAPYPKDGVVPVAPESQHVHGDPADMNDDTRFRPHSGGATKVE
jgi:membrane protein